MNILELPEHIKIVTEYIRDNWSNCIRFQKEDVGEFLGLPYPYTVPSMGAGITLFFYWDTYFTNLGLIKLGHLELAKHNVDNLLYELGRHGYVPNANLKALTSRSQPPLLSLCVRDIYKKTFDKEWLKSAYDVLKKEYNFWMTERITPLGLNRYYHSADKNQLKEFMKELDGRFNFDITTEEELLRFSSHYLGEAESGWDFTSRFLGRCNDFIPVDLNSYLYMNEQNFAYFAEELGNGEKTYWLGKMAERKYLMNKYLWSNERELFVDYDYVNKSLSTVDSIASYTTMFAELANEQQALSMLNRLTNFEYAFGVSPSKPINEENIFQWDYPNGWPPIQYLVAKGLSNYSLQQDAVRIAAKYLTVICKLFKETGNLWEKYNVVDGSLDVSMEYDLPKMMGWTAGVFITLKDID